MFPLPVINAHVPAFIAKLWHMVSNGKSDNLICWSKEGRSVIIRDHIKFSSQLLPLYYKHNNMASFIRQLNKYGFRKILTVESLNNDDNKKFEFVHPYFIRNRAELLVQIKRKLSYSKDVELKTNNDSNDVVRLLAEIEELKAKHLSFETQLSGMKNENDALWREQSILRHRYQGQQKLIKRLLQFLLVLIQKTRGFNMKQRQLYLMETDNSAKSKQCLVRVNNSSSRKVPFIYPDNSDDISNMMFSNKASETCYVEPIEVAIEPEFYHLGEEASGSTCFPISPTMNEDTSKRLIHLSDDELSQESTLNLAVPLQEVSPAIVQIKHDDILQVNNNNQARKKQNNQTTVRKSMKRKHEDEHNTTPNIGNKEIKLAEDPISSENLLIFLPNETKINSSLEGNNVKKLQCKSRKRSPNRKDESSLVALTNNDNNDADSHLDAIEWDFDLLKNIMQSEGLSLDASMLNGILNNDDPLSLLLGDSAAHDDEDIHADSHWLNH